MSNGKDKGIQGTGKDRSQSIKESLSNPKWRMRYECRTGNFTFQARYALSEGMEVTLIDGLSVTAKHTRRIDNASHEKTSSDRA